MKKLITYIWMDNEAEEAAKFYKKVFKDDFTIGSKMHYLTETPSNKKLGSVMTVDFELFGQRFALLNGGPFFKPNEAISFQIDCKDQKEIDYYTKALSSDPKAEICGWVKDKYGVSWQISPTILEKMMKSSDKAAAKRAMDAMLKMGKIVIADLEKAFAGK